MSLITLFTLFTCASAVTRRFAIDVQWGTGAPDGFERRMMLVNGTSPGPPLVVDQGDNVEFYVRNGLDVEATVHFHGIVQQNTPWSDGVPGLSQRPIAPGSDWLYKWTANEYGAYWYHAHYQAQASDGFYGPILIRPRQSEPRPFSGITNDPQELRAIQRAEDNPHFIMVADWQHVTSEELYDIENRTNIDVYCSQSILFNGKGSVPCLTPDEQRAAIPPPFQWLYAPGGPMADQNLTANGCAPFNGFTNNPGPINPSGLPKEVVGCEATQAELSDFKVDPAEQWATFHLMSSTSILAPVVSLDGHVMWVYAVDGRYIEPYRVHGVQLYSGERYSVMIPLNQAPGTYTFRASHLGFNQILSGYATVTYTGGDADEKDEGGYNGGGGGKPPSYGQHFPSKGHQPHSYGEQGPNSENDPAHPGSRFPCFEHPPSNFAHEARNCIKNGIDSWLPGLGRKGLAKRQSDNDSQAYFTYGGFPVSQDVILLNTTNIVPFPNVPPARDVDATHIFYMSRFQAPWLWTVTGRAAYPSHPEEYAEDTPLLYYPNSPEANNRDLVVRTQNNTWIDLVFFVTDIFGPPHPMHKHSNKAYVIGKGVGNWTWDTVAEAAAAQPQYFNFENPPLRDGYATEPSAGQPVWLVIRYHVENPGAFMLHCHIQTHLAGGMAVALLDGVEDFPEIPEEYAVDGNGM
ncbi:Laccase-1 [Cercospora beticola]|uniref:Laccase-1 n=1 Tax=Cercospora beticola TaxID=122368 RepID=A0A2G5H8E7_CERBT|nr:Laccase-1 [Cercospora beticola]PIA88805.1 Laccase-1 [Cercospora beticola]WPB02913.1 hypothetical protein RHO25_007549 [Cercospora beticola]